MRQTPLFSGVNAQFHVKHPTKTANPRDPPKSQPPAFVTLKFACIRQVRCRLTPKLRRAETMSKGKK